MATRNSRAAPVKWPHPGGEAPSTGAPSTGGAGGRLGAALDTVLPGVSSLKSSTSAGRTNPAAGTARRSASDARGGASGDRSPSQRLVGGAGVDHSRGGGGGGGGAGQLGQTSGQQGGLPAAGRDARRVENSGPGYGQGRAKSGKVGRGAQGGSARGGNVLRGRRRGRRGGNHWGCQSTCPCCERSPKHQIGADRFWRAQRGMRARWG